VRALSTFDGVYICREPVDMRKSIDGLAAIVRDGMERVVCGRHLFVFVGRSRDRIKVLYYDRTGYALWYKRLERARFPWPKAGEAVVEVSPELFGYLLDGIDVFVKPHDDVQVASRW
jgi:transposase